MTRLEDQLIRACESLEIGIELGFKLLSAHLYEVHSIARIQNMGAQNGMLVVAAFQEVRGHSECLNLLGFGYSVLSEPGETEAFDLEGYREMFCDWGWTGAGCADPVKASADTG